MTVYTVKGSRVFVGSDLDRPDVRNTLPVATYVIGYDQMTGYFLTLGEDFILPSKLYGDAHKKAERFLNTFGDRDGTTGVLLAGSKGSGKSLVMKLTSLLGLKQGYPTLIVSSPYSGESFNQFIQSIDTPCIMILDEFEKLYDDDSQEQLLTLFDGTFNSKKMVIATCNDSYRINSHMTNRPGRMYYYLKYSGVTDEFIREYCADRLNDQSKTDTISKLAALFTEFNFDMLKALVEELNRYPEESVKEAVSILNINYDHSTRVEYEISVSTAEGVVDPNYYYPNEINNPIQEDQIEIRVNGIEGKPVFENVEHEDGKTEWIYDLIIPMQDGDVVCNRDLSKIEVKCDEYFITFTKAVPKHFDFRSLL